MVVASSVCDVEFDYGKVVQCDLTEHQLNSRGETVHSKTTKNGVCLTWHEGEDGSSR